MNVVDPFAAGYLPILVVDSNGPAAQQLADRLQRSGFHTDVAISCTAAHIAARAKHYGSIVVVADLSRAIDRNCLAALRKKMPNTWIIAISATVQPQETHKLFRRGIDSLLGAPFPMEELISRLSAFSRRSRPP